MLTFEGNTLAIHAYRADTNEMIDTPYIMEKTQRPSPPAEETRLEGWEYMLEEILGPYAVLVKAVFSIAKFVLQRFFSGNA